jgi:hypothetical protein
VRKQEERRKGAARATAKLRGEESSSESETLGDNEEDEEGEIISSPCSPPPPPLKSLPLPGVLSGQQIGVPASARQAKCPRADAGEVSSPSSQPSLALVCSVLWGMHAYLTGV